MKFDPFTKIGRMCKDRDLWNDHAFNAFCSVFEVRSMAYFGTSYSTHSASYFSRFLATFPQTARMRKSEGLNHVDDNMDVFWHLFDHVWAYRTILGSPFITAAPYLTWEEAVGTFAMVQDNFPIMRNVDMCLVPDDYKYIKNGTIMVAFLDWRVHAQDFQTLPISFGNGKLRDWRQADGSQRSP